MNYKEKNEVLKLLPWYQLGKLNKEDTLRVETALAEDSALAEELALEKKLASLVSSEPELLGGSSLDTAHRLENVLSRLEDNAPVTEPASTRSAVQDESQSLLGSVRDKLSELLFGSAREFNYALIAAIIAVNVAVLGLFLSSDVRFDESKLVLDNKQTPSLGAGYSATDYSGQVLWLRTDNPINITNKLNLGDIINKLNLGAVPDLGDMQAAILPSESRLYRIQLNKPVQKDLLEKIINELQNTPGIDLVAEEFKKRSN